MAKRQRTEHPAGDDPGARFLDAVQGQDRVILGEGIQRAPPRIGAPTIRLTRLPAFPVRIGWGAENDHANESSDEDTAQPPNFNNASRTTPPGEELVRDPALANGPPPSSGAMCRACANSWKPNFGAFILIGSFWHVTFFKQSLELQGLAPELPF